MVDKQVPFHEQKSKSIKENLELFNRVKILKNRALKLLKREGEKNDENI